MRSFVNRSTHVDSDEFVGLAYAIVTPGRATQIETFGVKDINGTGRVGPHTRFRIASLSKGFAGSVAGELIREDRLKLSTPLSEFRPDFRLKTATAANIPIEQIHHVVWVCHLTRTTIYLKTALLSQASKNA